MSHTKGNWKVDTTEDYIVRVVSPWSEEVRPGSTSVFGDYRGAHICEMHWNTGVPTKETAVANAALISAAPDLLEASKNLIKHLSSKDLDWLDDFEIQKVKDAIKKATNESNL